MSIEKIRRALSDSAELKMQVAEKMSDQIQRAGEELAAALKKGNKALFCGNGGSAADSQHIATELIVRLSGDRDRPALPAIALTTDSSVLTAGANDYGFDRVFSRQVEAIGNEGDILFAISTSGNSANVIAAVDEASIKKIFTIGFLGCGGGKLGSLVDLPLVIPSDDTQRIQEAHIAIGHIIIQIAEEILFP